MVQVTQPRRHWTRKLNGPGLGMVAACALLLSACVEEPLITSGTDEAVEPPYTASQARRDIDALDRALKQGGESEASAPFVISGLRGMLAKDFEAANDGFQRALKFEPRNAYLHTMNALAHQLRGEAGDPEHFELAQVGYELAEKMDPGNSQVPYFLGLLKFRQQRFIEAREQFARAVMLMPDEPDYLNALAATSYYLGELDVAHAVAHRAKQLDPYHPDVLRTSGIVNAALGDFNDAEASKNALEGISRARKRYVGRRIDDWARYYANNGLMKDPEIVELMAQNLDPFGVPSGGLFDPDADSLEDPNSATNDPLPTGNIDTQTSVPTSSPAVPVSPSATATPALPLARTVPAAPVTPVPASTSPLPAAASSTSTQPAAPAAAASAAPAQPAVAVAKPAIKLPKMALIDVAIIRTEEIYQSGKGVNLLNGLNIFFDGSQFLQFKTPFGLGRFRTAGTANDVVTLKFGTNGAGLTYSLNIFSDAYDRNEVIARPTILVEDQKKSSFFSGGTLHIVIEGGVAGSGAIQPINTGVRLEVTPKFLDDETVEMSVFAQRTFLEASLSQVSSTITGTSFATTSKTSISANLTLGYGETMVLSGLSDQEKEKTDDKVPGLGDIPAVQYLFRRQEETSAKKTVLILLTPRRATLDYNQQAEPLPEPESVDTTNIGKLQKTAPWMQPAPHLSALVRHLSRYEFFNHFRTGDMQLENWAGEGTVLDAIKRHLEYLYIYYDFEAKDEPELGGS